MAVTVGIDIGTTAVKAVAADDDGRVVARARLAHGTRSPGPGTLEHDIDLAWRANVQAAWDQVRSAVEAAGLGPVAAVQVAAMVPSLGAVDAAGRGAGPGLLYGDVRGGAEPGRSPADSGEWVGFLRWLAGAVPHAAGYWPAQAVANHALGGVAAIDTTTAVTAAPAFDFVGWDPTLCAALSVDPAALPAIVPGAAPAGEVLGSPGTLLGGGTIDALGEQWVAGANDPGDVLVVAGASLITWLVTDTPIEADGLWTVPHTWPGRSLVGGPSNAGGIFVDWLRRLVGPTPADGPAAGEVAPGDVPVWAPYLKGERTPLHDPTRRAQLVDLGVTHGPAHLWRAAHEATGFVVRHHLDRAPAAARGAAPAPRRIVMTGGGSRSAPWVQAMADVTGLPVDVVGVPEGAALGAAFLARVTAGLESRAEDAVRWARVSRTVAPDPAWAEATAARYERFLALTG